jgi:hypothetical protein
MMQVVSKLHDAIASKPAQQDASQGHELEHELCYRAEKYEALLSTQPATPVPIITLQKATDIMAEVAKVASIKKATLDRPTRIPKYGTRLEVDVDICQHMEDLAQEARLLAAELAAAAAEQERLQAKSGPPVQPRGTVPANTTLPVKCTRADASISSETLPSKKHKPPEVAADAKR